MVLVQNKYKNTLVGILRIQITFVMHSSSAIRLNSGNLGPQKTDSGVFIIRSLTCDLKYKDNFCNIQHI